MPPSSIIYRHGSSRKRYFLVWAILMSPISKCLAFLPFLVSNHRNFKQRQQLGPQFAISESITQIPKNSTALRPCYFKDYKGKWKQRLELDSLTIGQALECSFLPNATMIFGKTGPKIFVDCGVGRCRDGETWKMVFGMLRLDRKESAARKKLQRLKSKPTFTGYVSRIRPSNDQYEIVLSPDSLVQEEPRKVSISSLSVGQEVIGRVERVEPYGVLVRIQMGDGSVANRHGLLHIQKVADLFGTFINKEEGLKEAGLGRGERIKLQVASVKRKGLFLDFTEDAKAAAEKDREEKRAAVGGVGVTSPTPDPTETATALVEAAPLDEVTSTNTVPDSASDKDEENDDEDYDDDDDWEDEYDEDRDIEDQLGLGTY